MAENPIIEHGATITDLAALFGIDRKQVRERIGDVPSRGMRGNLVIWRVKDVAPRLAKMDGKMTDIVRRIMETHHTDLPKMLAKEFWQAQNSRLRYLKDTGDLWDTSAVVELAAEVFKTLRLSLMLAADAVERETTLSPRQREIIENLMHEALNDAREKLVVRLTDLRKNTSGKAFAPAEEQPDDSGYSEGVVGDGREGLGSPEDDDDL